MLCPKVVIAFIWSEFQVRSEPPADPRQKEQKSEQEQKRELSSPHRAEQRALTAV